MVDADGLRINKVLLVAGEALGRKPLELAYGSALMTGIAIHRRVCADQREAIEVLVDLLHGNMPAPHRVALLAIGAHLALVDVRVAVCALRTHIRKDHLGVALRAGNSLMQAAQRVLGGVVIEFGDRADRLPAA